MRTLALAALVVAVGCSQQTASNRHVDNGGGPSFYFEPADLTTNHDAATRLALNGRDFAGPPSGVSDALSLRTYPADSLVAATVQQEAVDAGVASGTRWVLHPTSPLAPGWYAEVVAGFPMKQAHQRADGAHDSRFRIGSQPLLLGVGACPSSDPALLPKLRLDFSEAVKLPAGDPPIDVAVDGKPAACTLYDPPSEVSLGLGLNCAPPIPDSAVIVVTVHPGIMSASSGSALGTSSGDLPRDIELPKTRDPESCRYWHELDAPKN